HRQLQPIEIYTYFSQQPILEVTSSIQHIDADDIESQHTHTLLPSLNNIAGLRMEERSPGSYRLAMRGSLIRSAFGIRNIKVYIYRCWGKYLFKFNRPRFYRFNSCS